MCYRQRMPSSTQIILLAAPCICIQLAPYFVLLSAVLPRAGVEAFPQGQHGVTGDRREAPPAATLRRREPCPTTIGAGARRPERLPVRHLLP